MGTRKSLRALLEEKKFIVAPGVYDGISARFAAEHGFDALYMTGHGVSMSSLGIPDIGTATYTEMVRGVQVITSVIDGIPLIADGDTGYGALLNVERTIRGYEAAGAAAIQIEDQAFPKKCGHTPGRILIDTEEMVKKIRVAVDTRDEALRRGEKYFAAGADILFVESPENEEELYKIGRSMDGYLLCNEVEGGRTPILPAETLKEMGFNIAIYPGTAMFSAAEMYRRLYGHIARQGTSVGCEVPIMKFDEWCRVIGFPEAWAFEAKYGAHD